MGISDPVTEEAGAEETGSAAGLESVMAFFLKRVLKGKNQGDYTTLCAKGKSGVGLNNIGMLL